MDCMLTNRFILEVGLGVLGEDHIAVCVPSVIW